MITLVFHTRWSIDWNGIVAVLAAVTGVAAIAGGIGAFAALAKRPAPVLRSE